MAKNANQLERCHKRDKTKAIRQWSDDDAKEEDVINWMSNGEDEGQEDNRSSPKNYAWEEVRPKEKEDDTSGDMTKMLTSPHKEVRTLKRGSQRNTPMMMIMMSRGGRSVNRGRT